MNACNLHTHIDIVEESLTFCKFAPKNVLQETKRLKEFQRLNKSVRVLKFQSDDYLCLHLSFWVFNLILVDL